MKKYKKVCKNVCDHEKEAHRRLWATLRGHGAEKGDFERVQDSIMMEKCDKVLLFCVKVKFSK